VHLSKHRPPKPAPTPRVDAYPYPDVSGQQLKTVLPIVGSKGLLMSPRKRRALPAKEEGSLWPIHSAHVCTS
jgi:hypothetical protein